MLLAKLEKLEKLGEVPVDMDSGSTGSTLHLWCDQLRCDSGRFLRNSRAASSCEVQSTWGPGLFDFRSCGSCGSRGSCGVEIAKVNYYVKHLVQDRVQFRQSSLHVQCLSMFLTVVSI